MADSDERRRILDMLASGQITAEQATSLLGALGPAKGGSGHAAVVPHKGARVLRITVDAQDPDREEKTTKIRINVPLALARFAGRFIPPEARAELNGQGIDLGALLDSLGDEVPDGRLVDIDAVDGDDGKSARIVIEVA